MGNGSLLIVSFGKNDADLKMCFRRLRVTLQKQPELGDCIFLAPQRVEAASQSVSRVRTRATSFQGSAGPEDCRGLVRPQRGILVPLRTSIVSGRAPRPNCYGP